MDIDRLKLFIDVANKRSFAAVARDHDQDPSTISRTIAGLETEDANIMRGTPVLWMRWLHR